MQKENKINTVVENAFKSLTELVDVNTVIGQPFVMEDGDQIFPISKVTLGVLCGGGEYGKISLFEKNKELPFSAGNGSIISLKPCGFLIKSNNQYKMISIGGEPYEKILEKASEIINSIKGE